MMHARVRDATQAVDRAERALRLIGRLIARFAAERFDSGRLVALHRALVETRASAEVAALSRWVTRLAWQGNQFFAPLGVLLLWRPQIACAIEHWRRRNGPHVGGWLDALADLEALVSLSAYTYERPDEPMPEIDDGAVPAIVADALGHPLIPRGRCARNDVALGAEDAPRLYVVSGSNMSGKSTLLRTIGLNAVLALAGAPVRARRLRLTRLQVGTSMRVEDSIADGVSRFYAEVKRLRLLVDRAEHAPPPLLFLIDELLSGTNSHDRRIGAEALVRALLGRGAVGLVTTHDLALSELGRTITRAANVHFEDVLDGPRADGQLTFDYRIRQGPIDVGRSNALALMRGAGLPV
jgi:DNA mismatch repair ATPase MutS